MIKPLRVTYTKPLAIIYNPNAGRKHNIKALIIQKLSSAKIPYEILESRRQFDTYKLANQLDINKYSAIVPVGGDGTYHEVINGMLMRKDKQRLPLAFIPNGSANELNHSFGNKDIGIALDFLVKGDTMRMDLFKCIIDH